MSDKLWKHSERRIAALLGGKRVPVSGRARGDAPDIEHPWLSIECKAWKDKIPAYLEDSMKQAEASAKPGQLPIAVLHAVGRPYGQALVQLRLSDWIEWFGDWNGGAA